MASNPTLIKTLENFYSSEQVNYFIYYRCYCSECESRIQSIDCDTPIDLREEYSKIKICNIEVDFDVILSSRGRLTIKKDNEIVFTANYEGYERFFGVFGDMAGFHNFIENRIGDLL